MRPHLVVPETYASAAPLEEMARQAGVAEDQIVRLNANENPFGAAPEVSDALAGLPLHLYPDPTQQRMRAALSEYTGHPPERLLAGAGSDELIDLLMRLFVAPGQRVLDCDPTFGMYRFCARIADAEVVSVPRDEAFEVDLAALEREDDERTKIVFLASPNNPTGNLFPEEHARELLKLGFIVVVDETYYEFSGRSVAHLVPEHENLVVLRTLSKWAGIAGLRVGYMIAGRTIVEHLIDIKNPYNVNVAAEAALLATLQHKDALLEKVRLLVDQRRRMERAFDGMDGVSYAPSYGNFLLCEFARHTADEMYQALARRGIFVRSFSHPRLTRHLRISVGTPEETGRMLEAVAEALGV